MKIFLCIIDCLWAMCLDEKQFLQKKEINDMDE